MLSIIIPARDDAVALERTLDHLDGIRRPADVEIIVAASGAEHATQAAVRGRAQLIWPPESTRAALMNAGAAVARGEVLLFLHADSTLPAEAPELIRRALSDPGVVGGAFAHRFAEPDWRLRLISAVNRCRYRLTRNYYGDQGLFVRRSTFHELGGYRALALLEDLDFSQRLKRKGATSLIRAPLATSGRRFLQRGPWRTLLYCGWLQARWTFGLDTERCAERWRGPAGAGRGVP